MIALHHDEMVDLPVSSYVNGAIVKIAVSSTHPIKKIKSVVSILSKAFNKVLVIVLFLLLPFALLAGGFIYLVVATVFYLYFSRLAKKIRSYYINLQASIESGVIPLEKLKSDHSITQKALDDIRDKIKDTKADYIIMPSLNKMLYAMKDVEMLLRTSAYPEVNEVEYTYDELVELEEMSRIPAETKFSF